MKPILIVVLIAVLLAGCLTEPGDGNGLNKPEVVSETWDYTVYKIRDGDNVCYWVELSDNPFPSHNDPLPVIKCVPSSDDDGTMP